MTDESPFDSAWLKWARAVVHAQALERDIRAWRKANGNPVRAFRAEYQPKSHGFGVIIKELDPAPVRWRLLLGDIASNYRAALDHLAWALVSRGRTPPGRLTPSQEKAIYFPISEDRHEFNCEIRLPPTPKSRLKLPGIRRADSAIVRRAQPYHCSPRARPNHSLVLLAGINTGDKHRAIQPLWAYPTGINIEITHMRDCVVTGTEIRRRQPDLHVNADIALIPARRRGANPELEMNLSIATTPIIGNRIGVTEWHAKTGLLIWRLLRDFGPQPAAIHEIGAEWAHLPPILSGTHDTPPE